MWVCVYIISKGVQGAHSKLGFAWFWPNWTSWSQFFVPGTIFESIWSIWTKNQISRPFRLEVTCIIGPYVFPFPILFYSITSWKPPFFARGRNKGPSRSDVTLSLILPPSLFLKFCRLPSPQICRKCFTFVTFCLGPLPHQFLAYPSFPGKVTTFLDSS